MSLVAAMILLICCWAPAPPAEPRAGVEPGLRFVAGGLVVPGEVGAEGRALTEDRVLVEQAWQPSEEVIVVGRHQRVHATAPGEAECLLLFRIGAGSQAPTAVAFTEDGEQLVVERLRRDALVVDAWQGLELAGSPGPVALAMSVPLPPACPAERPSGAAVAGPDHRLVVVEGPFIERSGETGWRVAVFR